jgi:hypothetical protein
MVRRRFAGKGLMASTTQFLTRRHEDTEAYPPHRTQVPCLRVKPAPVGSVLKDQHDAITHTKTRRHGGLSTVQNSTEPKLRVSVTPCETQLFIALWSLTSTTLFSHEDTKTRRLIHRTEPKLRDSVTPCETQLFIALWSLTSTTLFSHGATETRRLIHRTKPKLRDSVTPCETQLFIALWSLTSTTLLLTRSHGGSSIAQNPSSVSP